MPGALISGAAQPLPRCLNGAVTEIVIDLSEPHPLERESAPRAGRRQKLAALMAVVLTVLTVTGAQAWPKPELIHLATVGDPGGYGVFGAADGLIFRSEGGRIVAHTLDGAVRWRSEAMYGNGFSIERQHSWYVVSAMDVGQIQAVSVALDPATGQEKWRERGHATIAGDLMVVLSGDKGGGPSPVRRISTQETVWTIPPYAIAVADPDAGRVFTLGADQVLTEWELGTGAKLRSTQVANRGQQWRFIGWDPDTIRLFADGGDLAEAAVIDRKAFREKPLGPHEPFITNDCGPVLCAYGRDFQMSIVDRATGATLWRPPNTSGAFPTALGLLIHNENGDSWIAEFRTGAKLMELLGWQIAAVQSQRGMVLLERKSSDLKKTELAVVDAGGIRHLQTMPFRATGCLMFDDLLTCQLPDQKIGIWRIRWVGERGDHRPGQPASG